jgi:hypothetical protein
MIRVSGMHDCAVIGLPIPTRTQVQGFQVIGKFNLNFKLKFAVSDSPLVTALGPGGLRVRGSSLALSPTTGPGPAARRRRVCHWQ